MKTIDRTENGTIQVDWQDLILERGIPFQKIEIFETIRDLNKFDKEVNKNGK